MKMIIYTEDNESFPFITDSKEQFTTFTMQVNGVDRLFAITSESCGDCVIPWHTKWTCQEIKMVLKEKNPQQKIIEKSIASMEQILDKAKESLKKLNGLGK